MAEKKDEKGFISKALNKAGDMLGMSAESQAESNTLGLGNEPVPGVKPSKRLKKKMTLERLRKLSEKAKGSGR